MQYIFHNYKKTKDEKKKQKIEKRINEIEELQNDDVIELDEDGNIIGHDRVSRAGSSVNELTQQKDIDSLRLQVNALIKETQRIQREANWKRQCAMMLAGVTRALDPLFEKSRQRITEICRPLEEIRKTIKDDKTLKKLFMDVGGYAGEVLFKRGDKGSKIKLENYDKIISLVRKDCLDLLEDLRHESRSYRTHISKYGDIVRFLANKNPQLFKIKKLNKKEFVKEKARKVQEGIPYEELEFDQYLAPKPDNEEFVLENRSIDLECEIDEVWEENSGKLDEESNRDNSDIFASMKILSPEEEKKRLEEEKRRKEEKEKSRVTKKDVEGKFISLIMKIEQGRVREEKRKEKEIEEERKKEIEEDLGDVEDIEVVGDVDFEKVDGLLEIAEE